MVVVAFSLSLSDVAIACSALQQAPAVDDHLGKETMGYHVYIYLPIYLNQVKS